MKKPIVTYFWVEKYPVCVETRIEHKGYLVLLRLWGWVEPESRSQAPLRELMRFKGRVIPPMVAHNKLVAGLDAEGFEYLARTYSGLGNSRTEAPCMVRRQLGAIV